MALAFKKLGALLLLFGISVTLIVPPAFWLMTELGELIKVLSRSYSIVVVRTSHGYWPGSIVAGLGVFVMSLGLPLAKKYESTFKKMLSAGLYLMLFGLVLLVVGSVAANLYWTNHLKDAGYVQCSEAKLVDINRMNLSIWAQKSGYCEDSEVARNLSDLRLKNLEEVHRMIKKRYP